MFFLIYPLVVVGLATTQFPAPHAGPLIVTGFAAAGTVMASTPLPTSGDGMSRLFGLVLAAAVVLAIIVHGVLSSGLLWRYYPTDQLAPTSDHIRLNRALAAGCEPIPGHDGYFVMTRCPLWVTP